ncbi:hypothetical protein BBBOND_0310840 [Babesia bigemina]|uniref:Uncharacterized protein n=1 Tax=Babesia bigemina TaxID=5866 RepID=A0A061D903_BABBI|nr:hypothetical protein BBBOND_0310840 [Babesia bigemina]CDR97181.1 hypothetical protein BBBOND_0310840 [Babesia bigemina]|eukprot:XP_012769367.1 hypothetical protein BBBOND_0310840 [Babesia bigemina]
MALAVMMACGATAQVDDKSRTNSLNDYLGAYVNGKRTVYENSKRPSPHLEKHIFVTNSAYLKNKKYLLEDILASYQRPHPVKPYLEKFVEYLQSTLVEAKEDSLVVFKPSEMCANSLKMLWGVIHLLKERPHIKHDTLDIHSTGVHFKNPTKNTIDKHIMDTLLLICQQIYAQCYTEMEIFVKQDLPNDHQEVSSNDSPRSLGDGGNTVGSHEAITKGASSADSSALPSSSWADSKTAPLRIKRSMDARKPEPSVSSQEPGPSGVNPAPSDDDKQLQRQLSEGESGPAEQDDDKRSHNPPHNKIDENSAADWDEYNESYWNGIRKLREDSESMDESGEPLSWWKRFLRSMRKRSSI